MPTLWKFLDCVCIDKDQIHEALGPIVKKDFPLTQKFNNHR